MQKILENNLTLIAVIGIEEPLKKGIIDCIEKAKKAGINIRLMTSDDLQTAISIATKTGLTNSQIGL